MSVSVDQLHKNLILGSERITIVTDFRLAMVGVGNRNNIKTTRVSIKALLQNKLSRGFFDVSLLRDSYDRLHRRKIFIGPGLYLNEDHGIIILHNEVDFAAGRSIIARQ